MGHATDNNKREWLGSHPESEPEGCAARGDRKERGTCPEQDLGVRRWEWTIGSGGDERGEPPSQRKNEACVRWWMRTAKLSAVHGAICREESGAGPGWRALGPRRGEPPQAFPEALRSLVLENLRNCQGVGDGLYQESRGSALSPLPQLRPGVNAFLRCLRYNTRGSLSASIFNHLALIRLVKSSQFLENFQNY